MIRCLISLKGREARLGCMKFILHNITVNQTLVDYSELTKAHLMSRKHIKHIRQDDQFSLCELNYNKE